MPPLVDTEEERRKREEAAIGTRMPSVPLGQPQPRSTAFPAAPLSQPDDAGWRKAVHPGEEANQVHPTMPAVKALTPPAAPDLGASAMPAVPLGPAAQPARPTEPPAATPTAMPPVTGKAEMAAPSPAVQPGAMPPVPIGPQQQRYEDISKQPAPELHGWKRVLDTIGSIFPIGRAIEEGIPGSPQNYDAKLNQAALRAAKEQTIGAGQREAEAGAAKAQFDTPEKRRAYLAQHPDEFEGASDFQKNDFILAGKFPQREPTQPKQEDLQHNYAAAVEDAQKRNVDPASDPKVQQIADAITSLQKQTPEKVDKKIDEFVDPKNNRINVMQRPDGSTYNVARGQSRSEAGVGTPGDVKDIANGIVAGIDPPDLAKYGYRDRTAIAAELKRQGFDLARADQDWHATQKHLATLNGAQQERLRQAVSFTDDSLHILDGLYGQWQKVGPTSGWKVFNKASLATSKQLPGEAGNLAHRLEAQISDLTSELGTVYKGGNSSTDESLKLAAKNLEADWNESTFKDSINQIRQNLEIRKNSIRHSQAAGVTEGSPYTPKSESQTPKDFGDANGKPEGATGKLPDGTKVIVKGGKIVAQ